MSQAVSTSGSLLSVIVNPGSGSSAECGVTYVESLDLNNPVVLRELDSGSYVLYGKFKSYSGDNTVIVFESKLNANIVKSTDRSSVMIFNPVNSKVECLTIYDDSYERNDVALQDIAPPIICDESGTVITAQNGAGRPLRGLTVYGKTTQDGTPSEDAPVEMHSVGDSGDIVVSVLAGLPEGGTDRIAIIRQPRDMTGQPNETVTFSLLAIGRGLTYQWMYSANGGSTWQASSYSDPQNPYLTFTAKSWHDGYRYRCVITDANGNTVTTNDVTFTIGEASGSDDTTGDTQTATISTLGGLRGVPAMGSDVTYTDADWNGWIADTIEYDAQTGTAQIVRRVASVTYDGNASEGWVKGGSNSYFAIRRADKSGASHGLSTHYPGLVINAGENKVGFTAAMDKEYIRFRPAGYADMTVDAWRARLNASPVTVLYALAVPEITPITGDELAALTALRSRYPVTTIYNDAGAQMRARYVADTKNYVDQRIDQAVKTALGG